MGSRTRAGSKGVPTALGGGEPGWATCGTDSDATVDVRLLVVGAIVMVGCMEKGHTWQEPLLPLAYTQQQQ